MFGARLSSYNDGRIVPLYDSFGGTSLIDELGNVRPATGNVGYPPICGTRYVASAGGAVSEWMFCTDMDSQPCGDTDGLGNIVDELGDPVNPMDNLSGNPKIAPGSDAERLISHLIQNGHSYSGAGAHAYGGVTEAISDGTTAQRMAIQILVWCISDGAGGSADFQATCAASLPSSEQDRLLISLPAVPELELALALSAGRLSVGDTARFGLTTNVYHQAIDLTFGGSAAPAWSVCGGPGTLDPTGSSLVIAGADPAVTSTVTLCATAARAGSATIEASATPATVEHIAWSQSRGNTSAPPCQAFATFDTDSQVARTAAASVRFASADGPSGPSGPSGPTPGPDQGPTGDEAAPELAATGAANAHTALTITATALALVGGLSLLGYRTRRS